MADADYTNEIWKDIPGYDGIYQASSFGRIRTPGRKVSVTYKNSRVRDRTYHSRIMKEVTVDGYLVVHFCLNGRGKSWRSHRLICLTFHGQPPSGKTCVAHFNGDRKDNRPENLRWASISENYEDMVRHGVAARGMRHGMTKFTLEQVDTVRESQLSSSRAGALIGMSPSQARRIRGGKSRCSG